MSDLLKAGVLGAVQGATEFLPVSSSGHLILVPWLLGWVNDYGLAFDVALHLGTLGALLLLFWRDWWNLLTGALNPGSDRRFLGILVAATIPGAIAGALLDDLAESSLRAPGLVASSMLAAGALLWWADRQARDGREGRDMGRPYADVGLADGLLIGAAQALAIIPGVSRSGITISVGLLRGLSREAAVRFSFLLATPIVAGAGMMKFKSIIHSGHDSLVLVGILTSLIVGLAAIKLLLKISQISTFMPFVWYRVVLGSGSLLKVWLG